MGAKARRFNVVLYTLCTLWGFYSKAFPIWGFLYSLLYVCPFHVCSFVHVFILDIPFIIIVHTMLHIDVYGILVFGYYFMYSFSYTHCGLVLMSTLCYCMLV